MQTTVSTKGQIVLPGPLRRRLCVQAGDAMDIRIEAGCIILTPQKKKTRKTKVVIDSVTGLPVLTAGEKAPTLSSREVSEILVEFP